ncbi:MAG: hypothetical protein L0I92_06675 [Staphylococcus equorum]|nr:hypothetical protein [Staphylococcus equorum]
MTEKNYTLNYVNQHLLDCETGMDEIFVNVRGFNDSVEVVDVLGAVEDNGRVHIGLEVVTSDFSFGHIIHVSFMNVWEYVYKDEMIEIQDVLSNLISEQLKTDLGLKNNILDDVKQWLKENMEQYDTQEDLLYEIVTYGVENVAPNHLIYNDDIMDFYDEHYTEIDEILEKDNKKNVGTIGAVWYAWEKVAHEYLKALESK